MATNTPDNGALYICLNAKDLATSCAFYSRLGFTQVDGNLEHGWAVMKDGDNQVHLYQGHIPENILNFRGGDVFAIAKSLKEAGVSLEKDATIEPDGSAGAWIRDPDGNSIYFNTHPDEKLD